MTHFLMFFLVCFISLLSHLYQRLSCCIFSVTPFVVNRLSQTWLESKHHDQRNVCCFFCFLVFCCCCCCWVMIYWKSAWTFVFIRDNIIRIKHVTASVMQTFLHIHVLGCISDVHFRLLSNTEEDEGSRVVCERSSQTSYRPFRNDPDLW